VKALRGIRDGARILIVRLGAIGDVVHGLPLLCRLRRGLPGARITWLVDARAAPILEGHPCLDERIVLEKRRPLSVARALRALRARPFDIAIDIQGLIGSAALARLSGAPRVLGFDRRRLREPIAGLLHRERLAGGRWSAPVVEQVLAFADHLGVAEAPREFRLAPTDAARCTAAGLSPPTPFAAFIVGAGKEANRPFPETLARAARLLAQDGLAPVILGGPHDRAEAESIAREAGGVSLVGRADLQVAMALLERASVVVGGDTGPLHVAAALGRPVVALFGGSRPRRTGPAGSPSRVIWKRWACAPCELRRCPIGSPCLAAITPEEIRDAARALLRPQ